MILRQPNDQPACVVPPVWREQSRERWDEAEAMRAINRVDESLAITADCLGGLNDSELIAQPLDTGAGNRNRSLQAVGDGLVRAAESFTAKNEPESASQSESKTGAKSGFKQYPS